MPTFLRNDREEDGSPKAGGETANKEDTWSKSDSGGGDWETVGDVSIGDEPNGNAEDELGGTVEDEILEGNAEDEPLDEIIEDELDRV